MQSSFFASIFSIVILLTSTAQAATGFVVNKAESDKYLVEIGEKTVNDNAKNIDVAFEKQKTFIGKVMEKIDDLDLSASVRETISIMDGLGISLGYKYEVEPAFVGGDYYKRVDTYKIGVRAEAHRWFFDDNSPVIFTIDPETSMSFWQYYKTAADARKIKNGHTPANFPLTAKRAMERLNPGDLAHLRARLFLNIGAHKAWDLPYHFEVRGTMLYVLNGVFDIFVFKAENNKIRLRIAARRDRGTSYKVSAGVDDDFSIFGVDVVDNAIVRVTELDEIFMASVSRTNQNLYLGDYTLDLNVPEVREAYDELFGKTLRFRDLQDQPALNIINPTKSMEEVRGKFVSNLTKLNEIFRDDVMAAVPPDQRRVDRSFDGSNVGKHTVRREARYGIKGIYRAGQFSVRRENQMATAVIDQDGRETTSYYLFPTWTQVNEMRAILSTYKEVTLRSSTMIYETDKNYNVTAFKSAGFYYDYADKKYNNNEHQAILRHFQEVLPTTVHTQLMDFLGRNGFANIPERLRNVRMSSRYFVTNEGLTAVENALSQVAPELRVAHMKKIAISHLSQTLKSRKAPETYGGARSRPKPHFCGPEYRGAGLNVWSYCEEIDALSVHLAAIFDPGATIENRHAHMDALSDLDLYRKIGPSILFRMMNRDELNHAGFFEVKFYLPMRLEPLTFIYPQEGGRLPDRSLYDTIFDVQWMMDDVVPDMRIEGSVDNLTTRDTRGE